MPFRLRHSKVHWRSQAWPQVHSNFAGRRSIWVCQAGYRNLDSLCVRRRVGFFQEVPKLAGVLLIGVFTVDVASNANFHKWSQFQNIGCLGFGFVLLPSFSSCGSVCRWLWFNAKQIWIVWTKQHANIAAPCREIVTSALLVLFVADRVGIFTWGRHGNLVRGANCSLRCWLMISTVSVILIVVLGFNGYKQVVLDSPMVRWKWEGYNKLKILNKFEKFCKSRYCIQTYCTVDMEVSHWSLTFSSMQNPPSEILLFLLQYETNTEHLAYFSYAELGSV